MHQTSPLGELQVTPRSVSNPERMEELNALKWRLGRPGQSNEAAVGHPCQQVTMGWPPAIRCSQVVRHLSPSVELEEIPLGVGELRSLLLPFLGCFPGNLVVKTGRRTKLKTIMEATAKGRLQPWARNVAS